MGVPHELTTYFVVNSSMARFFGPLLFVAFTSCRKASVFICALQKQGGSNLKRALLLFSDSERANEISYLLSLAGVDCVTQIRQIKASKVLEKFKLVDYNAVLISEKVVSSQLITVCQHIREANPSLAILVSFHQPNSELEEKLFDIGVDDIVSEDAAAGSIVKRILVRMQTRQKLFWGHNIVGKATVDSKSFQIQVEGKTKPISKSLLELLQYFQCHPARIISREEVTETLWRDSVVDPEGKNLDMQVGKLRRLIEPNPKKPIIIRTVRGAGYVFDQKAGIRGREQ